MTITALVPEIATIAIVLLVTAAILKRKKKRNNPPGDSEESDNLPGLTGQAVVDTLESLGYFKYTDPGRLDLLKKEIEETYDLQKVLSTICSEKPPFEPYCRRLYFCDGEILFEPGGMVEYLTDVTSTFGKLGIPLDWSGEYFSRDSSEHTILVNDKKYVAFRGDPRAATAWDQATKNFVELLNDQLNLHHSEEKVYPVSGGNNGRIVFLTQPQYDFIYRNFGKKERPKELSLWWKSFADGRIANP